MGEDVSRSARVTDNWQVSRRGLIQKGARAALGGAGRWAFGSTLLHATPAEAITGSGPHFDFSDAFYLANGINPANILNRVNEADGSSVIDNNVPGPNFRDVRITNTTGGTDNNANLLYYVIT